jgi:hypothetical protein
MPSIGTSNPVRASTRNHSFTNILHNAVPLSTSQSCRPEASMWMHMPSCCSWTAKILLQRCGFANRGSGPPPGLRHETHTMKSDLLFFRSRSLGF